MKLTEKGKWECVDIWVCCVVYTQSEGCCGVANNIVKEHIIAPKPFDQLSQTKCAAASLYPWRHRWGTCSNSSHMSWVNPLIRGGESQKQEMRGNDTEQTWSLPLSDIKLPFSALTDFPGAFSELREKAVSTLSQFKTKWVSLRSLYEGSIEVDLLDDFERCRLGRYKSSD